MKIQYASMALLAGVSVICSSCVAPAAGYTTFHSNGSVSAGVAWTSASYDADGFPIFGYSYGRPVYGYTAAGAAVFTIAALTALCFVPHWGPASWYHGHHHYPAGCHRVAAPPRFPAGHRPGVRPPSGHAAPPPPRHAAPAPAPRQAAPAPAPRHAAPAPAPRHAAPAPKHEPQRPHMGNSKPAAPSRAQHNNGGIRTLPMPAGQRPVAAAPQMKAPQRPANSHVSTMPAPAGGKAIMPAPSASKPSAAVNPVPAPSVGRAAAPSSAARSRSTSAHSFGGRSGGHGGHRR